MAEVWIEGREFKTTLPQGIAIMRVLGEDLIEVRGTQVDGGEAVGEVAAGDADDGAGEQARCSEGKKLVAGGSV